MRHIWKTVFGGAEEEDVFFTHYYDPELCAAAIHDGAPAAMGHLLHAGSFISGEDVFPCAMIYAVATLPQLRGHGFGTAVVNKLISAGLGTGYGAVALCPAEDSLFEYYKSRTDLRECFFVREQILDNITPTPDDGHPALSELSSDEYSRLRASLLSDVPHIAQCPRAISYQSLLCRLYGGGLFRIETPFGAACAVVEKQADGAVWIKELLTPPGVSSLSLIPSIAAAFPAPEYLVRTPACPSDTEPGVRRFAMLAASCGLMESFPATASPWLGMAFD